MGKPKLVVHRSLFQPRAFHNFSDFVSFSLELPDFGVQAIASMRMGRKTSPFAAFRCVACVDAERCPKARLSHRLARVQCARQSQWIQTIALD